MASSDPESRIKETMKKPKNLKQSVENRAENLDEEWQMYEEYAKEKYLDRFRVDPRHALLIDLISILACAGWFLYYGLSVSVIVSVFLAGVASFSTYTLLTNGKEVFA